MNNFAINYFFILVLFIYYYFTDLKIKIIKKSKIKVNLKNKKIIIFNEKRFEKILRIFDVDFLIYDEALNGKTEIIDIKKKKNLEIYEFISIFDIIYLFEFILFARFKERKETYIKRTIEQLVRTENINVHLDIFSLVVFFKFNKYIVKNILKDCRIKKRNYQNCEIYGFSGHYCYFHALYFDSIIYHHNISFFIVSRITPSLLVDKAIWDQFKIRKKISMKLFSLKVKDKSSIIKMKFVKRKVIKHHKDRIKDPLAISYMNFDFKEYDKTLNKIFHDTKYTKIKIDNFNFITTKNDKVILNKNEIIPVVFLSGFSDEQLAWGEDDFVSSFNFYYSLVEKFLKINSNNYLIIKFHPNSLRSSAPCSSTKYFDYKLQILFSKLFISDKVLYCIEPTNEFYHLNSNYIGISRTGSIIWESLLNNKICYSTKASAYREFVPNELILSKENISSKVKDMISINKIKIHISDNFYKMIYNINYNDIESIESFYNSKSWLMNMNGKNINKSLLKEDLFTCNMKQNNQEFKNFCNFLN